jgi:predicted alpha/beta-fold hydrolase
MPYSPIAPTFKQPFLHIGGQAQTIIPGAFRKIPGIHFIRERILTPDDDFLDLDWLRTGSKKLVIISHGLEGSSNSQYVLGTARIFNENGWDVLAWNCRSCSGEMNKQFRLYHHGEIKDIGQVIDHAIHTGKYTTVALTGFSMGANITMKYLGVNGKNIPTEVKAAAVFSAPCDLEYGSNALDMRSNWIYRSRFMSKLERKIHIKNELFPGRLNVSKLKDIRRWRDFDEWFSAPMCGYQDAADFYRNSSPKYFIEGITIPTLLASAINDPILTPECFPIDIAKAHPYFHLELPENGGHCGFMVKGRVHSWAEMRALAWCSGVDI